MDLIEASESLLRRELDDLIWLLSNGYLGDRFLPACGIPSCNDVALGKRTQRHTK